MGEVSIPARGLWGRIKGYGAMIAYVIGMKEHPIQPRYKYQCPKAVCRKWHTTSEGARDCKHGGD
jgi:hypothetical protein